jgi:GNAT superfamily N-acetyltransferase
MAIAHPITIRKADKEDFTIIIRLANLIWPICFAGNLTAEQIGNMLLRIYNEENLSQEMDKGHYFWLAYEGSEPVGYASAYLENEYIWIKKLYILTEKQGKGIGTMLVNALSKAFPITKELWLLVNRENHQAQKFYLKSGFTCIGEVPVQMGDHQFIDLIYARKL